MRFCWSNFSFFTDRQWSPFQYGPSVQRSYYGDTDKDTCPFQVPVVLTVWSRPIEQLPFPHSDLCLSSSFRWTDGWINGQPGHFMKTAVTGNQERSGGHLEVQGQQVGIKCHGELLGAWSQHWNSKRESGVIKSRERKGAEGKTEKENIQVSTRPVPQAQEAGVSGRWNMPGCWNVEGIWLTLEENTPPHPPWHKNAEKGAAIFDRRGGGNICGNPQRHHRDFVN